MNCTADKLGRVITLYVCVHACMFVSSKFCNFLTLQCVKEWPQCSSILIKAISVYVMYGYKRFSGL